MSPILNDIKSFVDTHKLLCAGTLGLAIIGYAIGRLGGRLYQWLISPSGTAKKTDELFHETINSQNGIHSFSSLITPKNAYSAPVDAPSTAQSSLESLTQKQIQDINFVVTSLGNSSDFTIAMNKSVLEKTGRSLEPIHPLQFLSCIFTDPARRAAIRSLKNRKISRYWTKFYGGVEGNLKKMDAQNNLESHLDAFAAKVKINSAIIRPLVANKQWDKFVNTLIERVP